MCDLTEENQEKRINLFEQLL